jgi:cell division protein FtsB
LACVHQISFVPNKKTLAHFGKSASLHGESCIEMSALSSSRRLSAHNRRRNGGGFWNTLSRVLVGLVVMGGVVVLGLYIYPEISKRAELARTLEEKQAALEAELALQREREHERFLLENDPEYIEAIARDRLDLMKEGETIIRLDPAPGSPTARQAGKP